MEVNGVQNDFQCNFRFNVTFSNNVTTMLFWTPLSFIVTKSYIDFDCMDKITLRHFSKYMHFREDRRHTGLKRDFGRTILFRNSAEEVQSSVVTDDNYA